MTAYVIVDIQVHDPQRYEGYKQAAAPTVAQYGGRYLVRGGRTEVLEGDREPNRLVILEFESIEQAKKWLHSPDYAGPRALRHETATTSMIAVEGV